MDKNNKILSKINNIILYSIFNEKIRDQIGFRMVSGLTKNRGWYFWLHNFSGVFDLFSLPSQLENVANFLIKYYPAGDEVNNNSFSERERNLRNQFVFEKGAPQQEIRDTELANDFIIGNLDIFWEQDTLIINTSIHNHNENELSEDAYSSQLCFQFYSSLLRTFCLFTKTAPAIVLSRNLNGASFSGELDDDTSLSNPILELSSILIRSGEDKQNIVHEILTTLVSNQTNNPMQINPWQVLFVENEVPENGNSEILDKSWWDLPDLAANLLPQELFI